MDFQKLFVFRNFVDDLFFRSTKLVIRALPKHLKAPVSVDQIDYPSSPKALKSPCKKC